MIERKERHDSFSPNMCEESHVRSEIGQHKREWGQGALCGSPPVFHLASLRMDVLALAWGSLFL